VRETFVSSEVLILTLGSRAAAVQLTRGHFSKQQSDRDAKLTSHRFMTRVKSHQIYTAILTRAFAELAGTTLKNNSNMVI
jgi:hypothetical protein